MADMDAIREQKSSFQVFVRCVGEDCRDQPYSKTLTLDVGPESTFEQVKEIIWIKENIPPDQQRLVFAAAQRADDTRLVDAGMFSESTMYLLLRLRGS
jgi:hypothetical protein